MEYKIYKIINIITNKLYIGKTTQSLLKRLADHIQEAKRWANCKSSGKKFGYNSKLYSSMNKHGYENFKIELIELVETKAEMNRKEKYWINALNTRTNGYNIAAGGNGGFFLGCHHTAEARKRIGEATKNRPVLPETCQKISQSKLGYKHSTETKEKIRQAKLGKKVGHRSEGCKKHMSDSHRIPILCVETNIVYPSAKAASIATGILRTSITNCLHSWAKTAGGFHWKKLDKSVKTAD